MVLVTVGALACAYCLYAANVGPKSYHYRCLSIASACHCVSAARLRFDRRPRSPGANTRVVMLAHPLQQHTYQRSLTLTFWAGFPLRHAS